MKIVKEHGENLLSTFHTHELCDLSFLFWQNCIT